MENITKKTLQNIQVAQFSDLDIDKTVTKVIEYLKACNLKISTAESCTGGLLSALITNVSGASLVFDGGVCTYSNHIKSKLIGVLPSTIEKYNVVSCEVAEEMALGCHNLFDADLCLTTTGIAGPLGGTDEIPVGTVCLGFYYNNKTSSVKVNFSDYGFDTREKIRYASAYVSFCIAYQILTENT
jgi:nicotinamide-nucleotide amidase